MVQEEHTLRKLFQKIFEDAPDNTMPKETLLQKLGYSKKQAINLYNQAAKYKIINSYLTTKKDKNKKLHNIIEVKLMTPEDWEIEEALDEIEDQIYQLRKQLHPEEY